MAGIFRGLWGRASWLCLAAAACGGARSPSDGDDGARRRQSAAVPLAEAIVLETSGPPPPDTSVTFIAGEPRVIVLRHGPPEYIVFAELDLSRRRRSPSAGARCGWTCGPRPGRVRAGRRHQPRRSATAPPSSSSMPGTSPRPRKARAVYGSDVAYERALAVGRVHARRHARAAPLDPTASRRAPGAASRRRHLSGGRARNDRGLRPVRASRLGSAAGSCRSPGRSCSTATRRSRPSPSCTAGRWGFLLESLEGGERWARYTFLATEPREVFRYRGRECARWSAGRRLAA